MSSVSSVTKPRMATDIPASITIPNCIETRLGTLNFFDGFPDEATVEKVYDNLDFQRAVQPFITAMPAASLSALREGLRSIGVNNSTVAIFETLMDSKSLFLTANTESTYTFGWLDLKDGPLVVETAPNVLGLVNDFWFHYVADLGNAGPDKGKGGRFLFLPPDYAGTPPESYFVYKSRTFNNSFGTRGFLVNGDPRPAVKSVKKHLRIYPLAKAANPPTLNYVNTSGKPFNTIHSADFTFFEEVNDVVQEGPADAMDPETLGLLASIGIEKGRPFAPDARMKKILTEAAYVANATARAIIYRTRMPDSYFYPNSAWKTAFVAGNHEFLRNGARILDARTLFHFYATGITPAMRRRCRPAWGRSTRWHSSTRRTGRSTAARTIACTCHRTFPRRTSGRSCSTTIRRDHSSRPIRSSRASAVKRRASRSIQIGRLTSTSVPRRRPARKSNWIQTWPGKGWNVILWPYGPLPSWFDKTWRPAESEEVP